MADLDEVVTEHPVEVLHRGGHTAIYNGVAFKAAGVDRETPDPQGGQFGRDQDGELPLERWLANASDHDH